MTIQEIQTSNAPVLFPADIAKILHCDPQYIRDVAQEDPTALGFPVLVMRSRVKIPRIPFLRYLGYLSESEPESDKKEKQSVT